MCKLDVQLCKDTCNNTKRHSCSKQECGDSPLRVLDIVEYFKSVAFWIENPSTGALKSQPIVQHLKRIDVSYCMYLDWGYMKKTSLWTEHSML